MDQQLSIWPDWKKVRKIGEGGYGTVYEIVRDRYSIEEHRALKVIRIPADEEDYKQVMSEGMDEETAKEYYRSLVAEFIKEIAFLSELRGAANIVTYDDYKVLERKDGFGWKIYIMMELLTPLPEYIAQHPLSEEDIIKLGSDICDALTLCHSKMILHRDIKADNIFVTREGIYKLGDFGIARTVEKTAAAHTRIGTNSYMAPETYRGQNYDNRADIYSLGILLYRLLNDNRNPFLPPYPEPVTVKDRDDAMTKRLFGDPLPRPRRGSDALCAAVLKACAFRPEDRYTSAAQMKDALHSIESSTSRTATDKLPEEYLTQRADDAYPPTAPKKTDSAAFTDDYDPGARRPIEQRGNVSYRQRGFDQSYRDPDSGPGYGQYDRRTGGRGYEPREEKSSSGINAGVAVVIILIVLVLIGGGITIIALLNRNASNDVTVEEDTRFVEAVTEDASPLSPEKEFNVTVTVYYDFDTPVALQGYVDGEASGDPNYITQKGPYSFKIAASKDTDVSIYIDGVEYYSCKLDYDSGNVTEEIYSDGFYSEHIIY